MDIYRLAVCEDDADQGQRLLSLCGKLLDKRQIAHKICLFSSAEELEETIEQDGAVFDLLLLDIQMAGKSGMELARELYGRRFPARFLFITGFAKYALEGYLVHPVHYLLKPIDASALDEALLQDWQSHHRARNLVLRNGSKTLSLLAAEVCYMESQNHVVMVHTPKQEYRVPMSLSEAERHTPPGSFFRCHNSFLVNLAYVEEIGRMHLRLRDGTQIPLGRRYYQSFQEAFVHYINQNTGC